MAQQSDNLEDRLAFLLVESKNERKKLKDNLALAAHLAQKNLKAFQELNDLNLENENLKKEVRELEMYANSLFQLVNQLRTSE
jgi:hypothetical protein